ncbi:MAG: HIT family protein [Corynebacterium sp.]|uniref:HIT family protein n=1 Tax=Corynebacterium sp. TaxID=1720 RepID=UPI0026DF312D|nr:HIT family protein [Corynebacterium sp.]MDO5670418.1 HIT family protein [Corynebacterium sp.]
MSVFTKIINGELPGRFVYRDDEVVAFLTIEPLRYGHVLVVPIKEVDRWTDLDPALWARLNEVAQEVGQAVRAAFDSSRAGYIIAGFDVPHTHIHVFPTDAMAEYDFHRAMAMDATDPELMDDAATRIRKELGTDTTGRR